MPFTISHAAVVLPFARLLARWRLLSAVVVGAMVPDFGLFFPWRIHRFESHSAMALITFCLPVGLTTYWIFQYWIKTPVLEVLPEGAYARWHSYASPADFASLRQWVLAACGVLAGAVTHLVWDAFTHENARGIRMIPWLEEPVVDIGSHRVAGVNLLQDGSSLLGLIVILAVVCYGLRRGREHPVPDRLLRPAERWAWVLTCSLGAIALSIVWLLLARVGEPAGHAVKMNATIVAVASLRGLVTSLLCTSLVLNRRLWALHQRSVHRPPS
jgi:Domain of unknown function (DUF4184)